MTTIKAFIKKYRVITFFALAFTLSWGCLLIVIGLDGFLGNKEVADAQLPFVYLAVLTGPSVASLFLTSFVHGKKGLRELFARLIKWRVAVRWYAVALLTAPLSMMATLFVLSRFSSEFLPGIVMTDDVVSFLLAGIAGGLSAGLFEELGWTGFAVPELRRRYGILVTGLVVGILWGAWHFPLFSGNGRFSGTFPQPLYLLVLLFSFLPAFRVLMVWVYDRTGSLAIAILMHMSLTASILIFQPQAVGIPIVIYDLGLATVLWIFVAVVAKTNNGHLSQRSLQKHPA